MILVKSYFTYHDITHSNGLEYQQIAIKLKNNSLLNVFNVYASPSVTYHKHDFEPIFNNPNSIVVGDFNAHSPLWYSTKLTERGDLLEDLLLTSNFSVLNSRQPTYLHHNGTTSVLDLVIASSNLACKIVTTVLNNSYSSDHSPVSVRLNDISPPHAKTMTLDGISKKPTGSILKLLSLISSQVYKQ